MKTASTWETAAKTTKPFVKVIINLDLSGLLKTALAFLDETILTTAWPARQNRIQYAHVCKKQKCKLEIKMSDLCHRQLLQTVSNHLELVLDQSEGDGKLKSNWKPIREAACNKECWQ